MFCKQTSSFVFVSVCVCVISEQKKDWIVKKNVNVKLKLFCPEEIHFTSFDLLFQKKNETTKI